MSAPRHARLSDAAASALTPIRRVPAALAIAVAVVSHLLLQAGMMLTVPGWTAGTFRSLGAGDQLSYLAIVVDGAHGNFRSVEPFTETGTIYYPRAYYVALGAVAHLTGADPASLWTVGGLAVQAVLVAVIGLTCILLTRRVWTGLLGFVPFLVGTLSTVRGDGWNTRLDSHAVLWGPFTPLFTLNGESVALAIGASALLLLVLVAAGRLRGRAAVMPGVLACAAIGLLAGVQTYAFLASTYVLSYSAAALGLYRLRRPRLAIATAATAAAVLALFLTGPALADAAGPLAMLVLGLTPAVPGLVALWAFLGRRFFWGALALALGAVPQTLVTVLGIVGGDEFLRYRESSSKYLGVPFVEGVVSGLPILLPLVFLFAAGLHHRNALWFAFPAGGLTAWAITASNDVWGANQEPYRLWIDTAMLLAAVGLPLVVWAAVAHPASDERRGIELATPVRRAPAIAAIVVSVLAFGLAFPDFLGFRSSVTAGGYISFVGSRTGASVEAAAPAGDGSADGFILPGPCVDPLTFKKAWGGRVAGFNFGMAWPDRRRELKRVFVDLEQGRLDQAKARAANVGWLLTDSNCPLQLGPETGSDAPTISVPYTENEVEGFMQLWRIADAKG